MNLDDKKKKNHQYISHISSLSDLYEFVCEIKAASANTLTTGKCEMSFDNNFFILFYVPSKRTVETWMKFTFP